MKRPLEDDDETSPLFILLPALGEDSQEVLGRIHDQKKLTPDIVPGEVWHRILSNMSQGDLATLAQVNQEWHGLVEEFRRGDLNPSPKVLPPNQIAGSVVTVFADDQFQTALSIQGMTEIHVRFKTEGLMYIAGPPPNGAEIHFYDHAQLTVSGGRVCIHGSGSVDSVSGGRVIATGEVIVTNINDGLVRVHDGAIA
nr:F-box protein [Longispora sp. (in: high G+C Gram-positive bacteria)]